MEQVGDSYKRHINRTMETYKCFKCSYVQQDRFLISHRINSFMFYFQNLTKLTLRFSETSLHRYTNSILAMQQKAFMKPIKNKKVTSLLPPVRLGRGRGSDHQSFGVNEIKVDIVLPIHKQFRPKLLHHLFYYRCRFYPFPRPLQQVSQRSFSRLYSCFSFHSQFLSAFNESIDLSPLIGFVSIDFKGILFLYLLFYTTTREKNTQRQPNKKIKKLGQDYVFLNFSHFFTFL